MNINEDSAKSVYEALNRQLNSFWKTEVDEVLFKEYIERAYEKTKVSYDASSRKYYLNRGFSVLNTAVYSVFLYYLAHDIGSCNSTKYGEGIALADKLYYLNKIMNGVEWYWNITLPEHFIVEHPLGGVLGKAEYGEYFSIYQGVTVGEKLKKDEVVWPTIGHHVIMFANSSIIGACKVGNWCVLSANAQVINQDIPDCSIVYGSSHELKIKTMSLEEIKPYFTKSWKMEEIYHE